MNILAFDTSTEKMGLAIRMNSSLYTLTIHEGFRHSEKLIPSIEMLFEFSGFKMNDIDLIGCTRGPGSFTGLRIGMATAKGLGFGKNLPVISVPTLDFYSHGTDYFDGAVLPVIDARKNRFYTAIYHNGIKKTADLDITSDEITDIIKPYNNILLTGPHSCLLYELIKNRGGIKADPAGGINKIEFLIDITEKLYYNGNIDSESQGPVYIRKSDAEEAVLRGK